MVEETEVCNLLLSTHIVFGLTSVRQNTYPSVLFSHQGLSLKPGAIIDSSSTTPQTPGLSNLSPQIRGPVQGPPLLPPQPLMQALPSHVPPMLPSHAPQLGAPYTLGQSLDCAPQVPILTSVPPPVQTSLPPASIQSTAPMLQNSITMTKVSLIDTGKYAWAGGHMFDCLGALDRFNSNLFFFALLLPFSALFLLTSI